MGRKRKSDVQFSFICASDGLPLGRMAALGLSLSVSLCMCPFLTGLEDTPHRQVKQGGEKKKHVIQGSLSK